jgi:predicted membrane chloride channel (bestrophin family)
MMQQYNLKIIIKKIETASTNCERIVKQPIPLAYTRHTSRFLSFYLLSLPFTLIPHLGWLTVPIMSAVCWSFTAIQEIGLFIENPFNKDFQIMPLNQFISVIRSDISGEKLSFLLFIFFFSRKNNFNSFKYCHYYYYYYYFIIMN